MLYAVIIAVLAVLAALLHWLRLRSYGVGRPAVTDDVVRQIEETGQVEVDEPLDLDEIREEEERFWKDQPWEEPEQW